MICAIYRSPKREQTYLYIEKKDDFSRVPEDLLAQFGTPQFAMLIALDKRDRLANADLARVKVPILSMLVITYNSHLRWKICFQNTKN